MLNNNCFPGRNGNKPKWLIIHGTAGGSSAQSIAQYFQGAGVSSHYVIGTDGQIVQCNNESDGAWTNGAVAPGHDPWWSETNTPNPNNVTISIEHCKPDTTNAIAITPAQQASSFWLIKDICQRNSIPMRLADASGGITGHYSLDPVNRSRCPGTYPWAELWAYLKGNHPQPEEKPIMLDLNHPTVASHFKAEGASWRCKDKGHDYTIHGEILEKYRSYGKSFFCGLSFLGLPKSNEIPIMGHSGVCYQRVERGVLCFDPNHEIDTPPGLEQARVYPMHIDSGVGQDPRVTSLQGENDALKALLASSKLGQINIIGKRVQADAQLIIDATQVQ